MKELEGLVAIVTGGARNIGRAIALSLAEGGAAVTIATRANVDDAKAAIAEIEKSGGRGLAMKADVTNAADVQRMVDETLAKFGRIDILVNNAGIRPENEIEHMTLDQWHDVMAVILDAPFLCTKAVLESMVKGGHGAIINIGGMTAYTGAMHRTHVVTAKAGLDGFTKALAVELAPKGVTVNLVAPGMIATQRHGESAGDPAHRKTRNIPVGRQGKPEEVAAMVRHLAGPMGRYLTGQTIHVNGGVYLP